MKLDSEALEKLRDEVDTSPLIPGGSGFRTHKLDFSNPDRIRVAVSPAGILFPMVFILMGGGVLLLGIFSREWPFTAFGAVFFLIGMIVLAVMLRRQAVFNLYSGTFVRNGKTVPTARIAALQALNETCQGKNTTYISRELNLVLDDGTRVNVFDHGNLEKFKEDAGRLAKILKVPIWDVDGEIFEEERRPGESDGDGDPRAVPGKGRGRNSPLIFIIIGIAFVIVCAAVSGTGLWVPLYRTAVSAEWESCPAVVVQSRLASSRGSKGSVNYRIDIEAKYVRDHRTYVCRRYDFFRSSFSTNVGVEEMRRIVDENPAGREITCLVDPDDPGNSVISREVPAVNVILTGSFAAIFGIAGLAMLIAGVCKMRKR